MKTLSKKIISLFLALTMVFSLGTTAFATDTVVDNQSKILINGHYYTEDEFNQLLQDIQPINTSDENTPTIVPRMVAAIPAWAIGEWLLPIAGAYITVKITPTVIKVGNEIIESSSKTFSNILNAIKEKKDKKTDKKKDKKTDKKKDKKKDKKNSNEQKDYNLTADKFISKYRKSSVRREFPSELLDLTVNEIRKQAQRGIKTAKTAWKLLTDSRFEK